MFPTLSDIKIHCEVGKAEEALLISSERPIVLLLRKETAISDKVFGASRFMGAFLPYTPLQHLLMNQTGPLVMTSANTTTLPIIKDDEEMFRFFECHEDLGGILTHNRGIERRLDDSVAAVINGKTQILRRARGYVPLPISIPKSDGQTVLACGAQQKSTVCLSTGEYCYPSTEMGDLNSREAVEVYRETVSDMQRILNIKPSLVVCDMHPFYESTKYALNTNLPVIKVQHHFAHIASVMAEYGLTQHVIGVAFDGTGYGADGTVWGGEFLIASPYGFERAGHIKAVKLLGSDESVRQGWKTAACMLYDAGMLPDANDARGQLVRAALETGVNTIFSSSMGRVFDAVSAILGICFEANYEGQCAIELENAAARYAFFGEIQATPFPFALSQDGGGITADLSPCLRALLEGKTEGQDAGLLSLRFHQTVCKLILDVCMKIRQTTGLDIAALSGGVFQNRILLSLTVQALERAGFTVYTNQKVPPNDGGISLGQAYIGRFA